MAKTKEELTVLKQEYKTLMNKLQELSEDELNKVTGGITNINDIHGLEAYGPYYFISHEGVDKDPNNPK